jgi:hypothetical protein
MIEMLEAMAPLLTEELEMVIRQRPAFTVEQNQASEV